jgi:BioD-like phosphotransacetylase family protein
VRPSQQVLLEAEVKKIPVIAVPKPTQEVASAVEGILARARFRQEKKIEKLEEILSQTLDYKTLAKELNP